jgi:CubicO group peptidase (beta-lactamase class C family)
MRISVQIRSSLLGTFLIGIAIGSMAEAQKAAKETGVWPTQNWTVTSPEEQGMDSTALAALVDFGAVQDMDSLVVTRHGKLVAEAYYAPFRPGMRHRVNSATKAVVSMLTGIAIQQGKLKGTDQPVLSFFDESKVANVDSRKRAITVQNLLDMTSGIDWTEPLRDAPPVSLLALRRSSDWAQFVLDQPMAHQPGSGFNYNSGGAHLLSAILTRQTGMGVDKYAEKNLFKPLGITDYKWDKDPQGLSVGGFGLYLQTRDMAKLGYLYLRGGEWDGALVVPKDWVRRVYAAKVPMGLSPTENWRYGDLWWTLPARDTYMMVGFHRQIILVMPKADLVVAMTGRKHYPLDKMLDLVTQSVKSESAIAANPAAIALLNRRVAEVAAEPVQVTAPSELAQRISGMTYILAANPLGVKEITFHFEGSTTCDIVSYVARDSNNTKKVTYRLGSNGQFSQRDPSDRDAIVSKGVWIGPSTLSVVVRRLEDAATTRFVLEFFGKRVAIKYENSDGYQLALSGEAFN